MKSCHTHWARRYSVPGQRCIRTSHVNGPGEIARNAFQPQRCRIDRGRMYTARSIHVAAAAPHAPRRTNERLSDVVQP
eukprot:1697099-Prymnesium_polylepis.1